MSAARPESARRPDPIPIVPTNLLRLVQSTLLLLAAIFFAFHYVHLTADFPNHSPWMDWSKYTDEGWYGDAAIRHFQLGHWYVPGDFNPAAALPALPFVEALVFRFTGVSLIAARALTVTIFGGILVASWLLLRRWSDAHSLAPAAAVLLLAMSPFCFVFTRLAIIEPLLILLTLLAMLAAGVRRQPGKRTVIALGLLLPAMVLAKTTALFLLPGIAWILFASTGYRVRAFCKTALPGAGLAIGLWLAYFGLIVRPHYLLDYRYLFSANGYTGITRATAVSVLESTVLDGNWMGRLLFPLALLCVAIAIAGFRRLRLYPLIPALILWAAGYTAFLAYHDNLQPRYYLVVAVPLTLLVPYVLEQFLPLMIPKRSLRAALFTVSAVCIAGTAAVDASATLSYVRHPEYSFVRAADDIRRYIVDHQSRDPGHSRLILSISGSDLSLMTGLPSICDDFGTLELVDRVKKYRPGWYVAWNQIEDDKMEALNPVFHVERVAVFPAMDDPDRNELILYRLEPLPAVPTAPRRRLVPRKLRSKLGQQPGAGQLQH